MSPIHSFGNMPTPVKAGLAVASGASLTAALYLLFEGHSGVLWILLIGLAVVAAVLLVAGLVRKRLRQRKAAPMERLISRGGTGAASGDVAQRARLDDMRKVFEEGVQKFRANGKNVYDLPWYVIVGETGSGKTEAIRHCNVGFPPGMQDPLQGIGGTYNMNWWFTNHAVILDTAGRLFEDAQGGASAEWREFLRLLVANRRNCPINGLLLVIPADSLIRDSADTLEQKGAKIAEQFDVIQRALEVRFPVFVLVTKCDKITGFKEFFTGVDDPTLQHQMMGWSNPLALDQPFQPEMLAQHMTTVLQRVGKRRNGLLLDPPPVEGVGGPGRRIDEVDALYAFPHELQSRIFPRLQRYLEMVFVTGQWSAKPLFLRGIYFTSSMQEGSALDADLAEALGVPVESLSETGRAWAIDRAYFLRDVFIEKVFREKGLVTRAANAGRQHRRRKLAVVAAGLIGALALAAFTWHGAMSLKRSIVERRADWVAAADQSTNLPVVRPGSQGVIYRGDMEVSQEGFEGVTWVDFYDRLRQRADQPAEVPWIFLTGDSDFGEESGFQAVIGMGVVEPLLSMTRKRLGRMPTTDHQWLLYGQALAELVRAESASAGPLQVDPLLRFVLQDEQKPWTPETDTAQAAQRDALQQAVDSAGEEAWIRSARTGSAKYLAPAAYRFYGYWKQSCLGTLLGAAGTAKEFRNAEADLQKAWSGSADLDAWREHFAGLQAQKAKLDGLRPTLNDGQLVPTLDQRKKKVTGQVEPIHTVLSSLLPTAGSVKPDTVQLVEARGPDALADAVDAGWKALRDRLDDPGLRGELTELDRQLMDPVSVEQDSRPLYAWRFAMYQAVDRALTGSAIAGAVPIEALAGRQDELATVFGGARQSVDDAASKAASGQAPETVQAAADSCHKALDTLQAHRGEQLLEAVLVDPALPRTLEAMEAWVADQPVQASAPSPPPLLSYEWETGFDARYAPEAAGKLLRSVAGLETLLAASAPERRDRQELLQDLARTREGYLRQYLDYWSVKVPQPQPWAPAAWADWQGQLIGTRTRQACAALGELGQRIESALRELGPFSAETELAKAWTSALDAVREQAGQTSERGNIDEWDAVLTRWCTLPAGPLEARTALLRVSATEVYRNYLIPATSGGYVARYWYELTARSLESLCAGAGRSAGDTLDQIRTQQGFPLSAGASDLPPADIEKLRGQLAELTFPEPSRLPGGDRRLEGLWTWLRTLQPPESGRGPGLTDDDRELLDWARRIMAVLPADGRQASAELLIPPAAEQAKLRRSAQGGVQSTYLVLEQGGSSERRRIDTGGSLGHLPYPTKSEAKVVLRFEEFSDPSAGWSRPWTVPGQDWAPLHLLYDRDRRAQPAPGPQGRNWYVEVPEPHAVNRVLWLELRFAQPMPDPERFPGR